MRVVAFLGFILFLGFAYFDLLEGKARKENNVPGDDLRYPISYASCIMSVVWAIFLLIYALGLWNTIMGRA